MQIDANDGIFRGADNEPYTFEWEGKYRLELTTSLPGTFRLPVPHDTRYAQTDLPPVTIITGERGSGFSAFLKWLTAPPSPWKRMTLSEAEVALALPPGEPRDTAGRSMMYIVIDLLTGPSPDQDRLVARVAGLVDHPMWDNRGIHLACVTHDASRLRRDPLFSSMLARGSVARLPHFNAGELADWAGVLWKKLDKREDASELKRAGEVAKHWMGGQPTLTHFFFIKAEEVMRASSSLSMDAAFKRAGEFLRDHTPHLVDTWKRNLATLIQDPEVRRLLKAYVFGEHKRLEELATAPSIDAEARLNLAGWAGKNERSLWGIRSACHQHWARQVLRGAH